MNWRDLALKALLIWWRITRPTIIGVRGIVADKQGRVLFVRHNYGSRRWYLPGGGNHGGETPDQTLVREIEEETGLTVEVTRLVGAYLYLGAYKRDHIFIFECKQLGGILQVDGGEISEAGWFSPDALPEHAVSGTGGVLEDWRIGRTGYGYWPEDKSEEDS